MTNGQNKEHCRGDVGDDISLSEVDVCLDMTATTATTNNENELLVASCGFTKQPILFPNLATIFQPVFIEQIKWSSGWQFHPIPSHPKKCSDICL